MAHNTENYQLGGGILYIAKWTGSTPPAELDYTDVGNCPACDVTYKVETKVHESSRQGILVEDKEVMIKRDVTLKFTLDEVSAENLTMYFQAIMDSAYEIRPLEVDFQEYAVRFVPDLVSGQEWQCEFWKVQLSAGGSLKLLNMKDWNTLEFSGKVLADVANHPTNRFWKMTRITG